MASSQGLEPENCLRTAVVTFIVVANEVNSSNMDQQADVNEQEVDDVCILQSRQFNVHEGNVYEVPKLGMEFDSEQHAFDYYSEYAHRLPLDQVYERKEYLIIKQQSILHPEYP
ncbi:hypothetical protein RJ639_040626 [Escallonia herrerae]|uniref:Protein FAR1-RELATED SEQUENCE n=1 Tax=Escallonia herrerae TaxID=1293975 RepID=A0AA88WPY9_9ASTE|nr:hypothetical protein RJ639_040626 [Escallonia herrerae]